MLNLILSGFKEEERASFETLTQRFGSLRFLYVDSDRAALAATKTGVAVAVVTQWRAYPTREQLSLIPRLNQLKIPAIQVLTGDVSSEAKVAAIEAGAIDCIGIASLHKRLSLLLDVFVTRSELLDKELDRKIDGLSDPSVAIGSPQMKELLSRLARVATLNSTILLTGETGVGKSTIARWIHQQSDRSRLPFVDVPCAALPSNLIESELFGHVRGAFTSADRDSIGKFSAAGKGTLLMDEIDCLPLEVQGKLLRAVERREFEKVGSTSTERFEARLVVATNRPLDKEVAEGRFRSDLFYRLGVMSFRIPALRERVDSIPTLANTFCTQFAQQHGRKIDGISSSALATLQEYAWPGNIRELRNALDYSVAIAAGSTIQWQDLPEPIRHPVSFVGPVPERLDATIDDSRTMFQGNQVAAARYEAERELLITTLQRNNNNRSRTAASLGISRVTLYKLLTRLHIEGATIANGTP